jgi:protein O-mannosyl-transferase
MRLDTGVLLAWRHSWPAVFALLLALGFATYAAGLSNQLILDDEYMVRDNRDLRDLRNVPGFFVSTPPEKINRGYYRPLMLASFALDRALFGDDRRAYHAVNIVLHCVSALLVWALLRLLLARDSALPALLGAVLFLVHPVQTEVVYLVTYRATCLAALFFFAALWVHLAQPGASHSAWRSAAIGVLYFASLASKEAGITLPVVMLMADLLLRERAQRSAAPYIACGLVLGGYAWLRHVLCEPSGIEYFLTAGPGAVLRAMTVVEAYAVGLVLAPARLIGTYDASALPNPASFADLWFVLSAAVLATLAWLCVRTRRAAPLVSFALGFHFVTLAPTYNIIPIPNLFGERFLYLPLFGSCLLAAYWLERACRSKLQSAAWLLSVCVCLLLAARSHVRAGDFRDAESYWLATVTTLPQSLQAQIGLATTYKRMRQCERALPHYEFALQRADPRPAQARPIYGEAASCYSLSGHNDRALQTVEAWLHWHSDDPGFRSMRAQLLAAANSAQR